MSIPQKQMSGMAGDASARERWYSDSGVLAQLVRPGSEEVVVTLPQ